MSSTENTILCSYSVLDYCISPRCGFPLLAEVFPLPLPLPLFLLFYSDSDSERLLLSSFLSLLPDIGLIHTDRNAGYPCYRLTSRPTLTYYGVRT